ncbi:MAG: helix-turn-helix transcriptional regulator [Chitinophagaceae bacterium]|nr:helix-turn-helix transcriptional regulator [Chitinophagaceae bacterium]
MQGHTNNDIAEKLFISYETVKSHRKNILEKTGAKNTAALINYYHQTFFEK